jgi:hypothetical protein
MFYGSNLWVLTSASADKPVYREYRSLYSRYTCRIFKGSVSHALTRVHLSHWNCQTNKPTTKLVFLVQPVITNRLATRFFLKDFLYIFPSMFAYMWMISHINQWYERIKKAFYGCGIRFELLIPYYCAHARNHRSSAHNDLTNSGYYILLSKLLCGVLSW